MGDLLQPTHLLVIAVLLLIIFGAKRLPELGKGLGEGLRGFKEGVKGVAEPATAQPVQQAAINAPAQSVTLPAGKANYRCPSCKNILLASAPVANAVDEKGFCPECGTQFDKKTAMV
jgi:sec-independent protein translocase protein TatA